MSNLDNATTVLLQKYSYPHLPSPGILWRHGGFMVIEQSGFEPWPGSLCCVLHFTLTLPLSAQMYKWVPTNLMLVVTLCGLVSHPEGMWWAVAVETLIVASCYRNRDKLWPDGPLGSYTDITFYHHLLSPCSTKWRIAIITI